ncbi:phytanoyl-CoA dioxygenase family protein [Pollutimonas sp. H1-120]|uniref:phytanoyl-CoA dioxygenase family protein n=1 Tax=Pollutimonas sp. H1-120 TaxID=3148824 RepID=UPI003B51B715
MKSPSFNQYGVLEQCVNTTEIDHATEELVRLGYTVLSANFSHETIEHLAHTFDTTLDNYRNRFGVKQLKEKDEFNTIRLPLSHHPLFIGLATHPLLLELIDKLIYGKYILNQQNGIINPPNERYNQDAWHRDLPYQHFVSDRPIIINALYCVDEFTLENGATYVLPGSHKYSSFPSNEYISKNSIQICAPAGSFIILDGMLYHRGSKNNTKHARRAINHVYTIPHIKQQISIPNALGPVSLDVAVQELFGYPFRSPNTVVEFIADRPPKSISL